MPFGGRNRQPVPSTMDCGIAMRDWKSDDRPKVHGDALDYLIKNN
jgi:hypothetical protein